MNLNEVNRKLQFLANEGELTKATILGLNFINNNENYTFNQDNYTITHKNLKHNKLKINELETLIDSYNHVKLNIDKMIENSNKIYENSKELNEIIELF